jgi:hypothetical protein
VSLEHHDQPINLCIVSDPTALLKIEALTFDALVQRVKSGRGGRSNGFGINWCVGVSEHVQNLGRSVQHPTGWGSFSIRLSEHRRANNDDIFYLVFSCQLADATAQP